MVISLIGNGDNDRATIERISIRIMRESMIIVVVFYDLNEREDCVEEKLKLEFLLFRLV